MTITTLERLYWGDNTGALEVTQMYSNNLIKETLF